MSGAVEYLFNQVASGTRALASGGGRQASGTGLAAALSALGDGDFEKVYVTYTLTDDEGRVYSGRTSGYGDPDAIVQARFKYHHMRLLGYGNPQLDKWAAFDSGYDAIRGREQNLIDGYGGVGSARVGNAINGISFVNPYRPDYLAASQERWGTFIPKGR